MTTELTRLSRDITTHSPKAERLTQTFDTENRYRIIFSRFCTHQTRKSLLLFINAFSLACFTFIAEVYALPQTNGVIKNVYKDTSDRYIFYGEFSSVDGMQANNIVTLENNTWRSLGGGTDGAVNAVVVTESGDVIVGGNFRTAGNVWVNHIAKWNGRFWQALGIGTNRMVTALHQADNGMLFVLGEFTVAGGETAESIAVWNGDRWLTETRAEELFLQEGNWLTHSVHCRQPCAYSGK